MSGLGRQVGIKTPGMDAVIEVASIVMARNYRAEALRTPETLRIAHLSVGELGSL